MCYNIFHLLYNTPLTLQFMIKNYTSYITKYNKNYKIMIILPCCLSKLLLVT